VRLDAHPTLYPSGAHVRVRAWLTVPKVVTHITMPKMGEKKGRKKCIARFCRAMQPVVIPYSGELSFVTSALYRPTHFTSMSMIRVRPAV
jgi:hypothetical protein